MHEKWLQRQIDLSSPKLQLIQSVRQQWIKWAFTSEHITHRRDQHRIENEPSELKQQWHQVLSGCATRIVAVTDSRHHCEGPVDGEDVGGGVVLDGQVVVVDEVKVVDIEPRFTLVHRLVFVPLAPENPQARRNVPNDDKEEEDEDELWDLNDALLAHVAVGLDQVVHQV